MKKSGVFGLMLCAFILILGLGCEKISGTKGSAKEPGMTAPPKGAVIVAKVGDFYITADDFKREIDNYNALVTMQGLAANKLDTREKKINYLKDDVVRKYILYEEALKRGLDKKEDVIKALEDTKVSLLVTRLLQDETQKIDVTSQEIEDFYNQNKDLLKEPEQRQISELVTNSEDEAKQVYIELLRGTDFKALAKQYSRAQTAPGGGEVGVLTYEFDPKKRLRFDKFYEVAFSPSLEAGGISNIFKGPDGYYIIKIDSINKKEPKPLTELWDSIKSYLLFEKRQKAITALSDRLATETKKEIYEGKIE